MKKSSQSHPDEVGKFGLISAKQVKGLAAAQFQELMHNEEKTDDFIVDIEKIEEDGEVKFFIQKYASGIAVKVQRISEPIYRGEEKVGSRIVGEEVVEVFQYETDFKKTIASFQDELAYIDQRLEVLDVTRKNSAVKEAIHDEFGEVVQKISHEVVANFLNRTSSDRSQLLDVWYPAFQESSKLEKQKARILERLKVMGVK